MQCARRMHERNNNMPTEHRCKRRPFTLRAAFYIYRNTATMYRIELLARKLYDLLFLFVAGVEWVSEVHLCVYNLLYSVRAQRRRRPHVENMSFSLSIAE